jgi:hypothetical protein
MCTATASLRELRVADSGVLLLWVAGQPQRMRAASEPKGRSFALGMLPKLAFGWSLLDAMRAHVQRETS